MPNLLRINAQDASAFLPDDSTGHGAHYRAGMADYAQILKKYVEMCLDKLQTRPSALAVRAQLAPSTLNRFLKDPKPKHMLSNKTLAKLAEVSGIPLPAELAVEGRRLVHVVGVLRAEGEVMALGDQCLDEAAFVTAPLDGGTDWLAVRVDDDANKPAYRAGDVIFYRPVPDDAKDCLGRECVIILDDGRTVLGELHQPTPGAFVVLRHSGPPIVPTAIVSVHRVAYIQKS